MIFIRNICWSQEHEKRLGFSVLVALALHVAVLAGWPEQKNIAIPLPTLNPTALTLHYKQPVEPIIEQPVVMPKKSTVVKKVVKKPVPVVKKPVQQKVVPVQEKPQVMDTPTPVKPVQVSPPLVKNPVIKGKRVQPVYPKRALRLRQEGDVLVHVLLDKQGKQQEIKVGKTSGYPLLDKSALQAVTQWRFQPVQQAEETIISWVEVPVTFSIR